MRRPPLSTAVLSAALLGAALGVAEEAGAQTAFADRTKVWAALEYRF